MAKIRNFSLPQELTEDLAHAAKLVSEDLLKLWGRDFLPGGFTRLDAIRERLIARVRGEGTLDAKLLDLLGTGVRLRGTVATLSFPALQALYHPLSVVLPRNQFLLALLLDPREHVHKWAAEQASKPAPAPATAEEDKLAQDIIFDFVQERLLFPAGLVMTEPDSDGTPADVVDDINEKLLREQTKRLEAERKTVERLNQELQQLKQRHAAKLKEQSDAADRDKKLIREALSRAQAQMQTVLKEKQALERNLKELTGQIDAAVAKGVAEQTSGLVRKWLTEPVLIESVAEETRATATDLVQRAEQALEAQAKQDRHTGTRLELERRLEALRAAHGRVGAALRTALAPIQDLRPLHGELDTEIARLEKVLSGARPASELTSKLLVSINAAETWEEVRACSTLVDQLTERALITVEDVRGIYQNLQRKFSLLEETSRSKGSDGDNGWSLRGTLYRNQIALLLLDGHNLLHRLKDIFSADYENGHPGRKARQRLVEVVSKMVWSRSNVMTKICFDGPEASCTRVAPNLEVHYSGGQGQNRADELIVAHLQFKDLKSLDQKVFVVTDDREVRRGILQTGAKFVPCDLFAVFLNDFRALAS